MEERKAALFWTPLVAIALGGAAVLLASTRLGPGVGGDATIYIYTAKNLIAGKGLGLIGPQGEFRLLPYFPPFFPIVLAALGLAGFDIAAAAGWLNVALFAGIILLTGGVMRRFTRSPGLALLLAAAVAASPILVPVYSWSMSEPLCIFLGFLSVTWGLDYLADTRRRAALVASALAAGLSFLTRYSAAAFLAAGALAVLLLGEPTWRRRIKDALLYAALGAIPMFVWLSIDLAQTTTVSSRRFETLATMARQFLETWGYLRYAALNWLLPDSWLAAPPYPRPLNTLLFVAALLGLAAWAALAVRARLRAGGADARRDAHLLLGAWLILFAAAYIIVVVIVYTTTFPTIDINPRMMSPVYVACLWLVGDLAGLSGELWPARSRLAAGLLLAFALVVAWNGWRTQRIVAQNAALGLGYNSVEWRSSELIQATRALPPETILVTDDETAVLYLTGRPAYPMREPYFDDPAQPFTRYGEGDLAVDAGERAFRQDGAALVLFDTITAELEPIYGARTAERVSALTAGLYRTFQGRDGSIYYYHEPAR